MFPHLRTPDNQLAVEALPMPEDSRQEIVAKLRAARRKQQHYRLPPNNSCSSPRSDSEQSMPALLGLDGVDTVRGPAKDADR